MKALYIIGFWNSGTTMLVDLLRKNPELKLRRSRYKKNLEESTVFKILRKLDKTPPDFINGYKEVIENGLDGVEDILSEKEKVQFLKIFKRKFSVSSSKTLFIKNPWWFFLYDLMQTTMCNPEHFDAKKVLVLRDGPAQNISQKIKWEEQADRDAHLIERAQFWVTCMERYFETWYNDPNLLTIRYENLCSNPKAVVKQICDFHDIECTEKFLATVPESFQNRTGRKDNLPEDIRNKIVEITKPIQDRIDKEFLVQ